MKNIFRVLSGVAAAFVLAFGITVGIAEQTLQTASEWLKDKN